MNQLEEARIQIDEIDKALVSLLEERLTLVTKVASYKKEHNLPIFDRNREEAVLEKISSYVKEKTYQEAIRLSFQDLMKRSKDFQKEYMGG